MQKLRVILRQRDSYLLYTKVPKVQNDKFFLVKDGKFLMMHGHDLQDLIIISMYNVYILARLCDDTFL